MKSSRSGLQAGQVVFLLFFLMLSSFYSGAQSGCTDPLASNYNDKAKQNDGSCTYPYTQVYPDMRGSFDALISESSGLVFTYGKLWTHDDSGNPACIFSIDTTNGKTLQTVYIDNFPNTDWEDITADSAYIYIEDAGNNDGIRIDLKILKIKKADINNDKVVYVNAESINFSYQDQTSFAKSDTHNFDCESLMSMGNTLYLFTKDRGDLKTRVYRLPKIPGTYKIIPYTGYAVSGLITGADYDPVKKEVVLIGYYKGHFNSFLWILNDFRNDSFFTGNKRRIDIGSGTEWAAEGVCYNGAGRLFISCEAAGIYKSSLFSLDESLWQNKSSGIETPRLFQQLHFYPNPANSFILISNPLSITKVTVKNQLGQVLFSENINTTDYNLGLDQFSYRQGLHFIKISTLSGDYTIKIILAGH